MIPGVVRLFRSAVQYSSVSSLQVKNRMCALQAQSTPMQASAARACNQADYRTSRIPHDTERIRVARGLGAKAALGNLQVDLPTAGQIQ